jgi:hypothetical protein
MRVDVRYHAALIIVVLSSFLQNLGSQLSPRRACAPPTANPAEPAPQRFLQLFYPIQSTCLLLQADEGCRRRVFSWEHDKSRKYFSFNGISTAAFLGFIHGDHWSRRARDSLNRTCFPVALGSCISSTDRMRGLVPLQDSPIGRSPRTVPVHQHLGAPARSQRCPRCARSRPWLRARCLHRGPRGKH